MTSQIEIKNVTFQYPGAEQPVLNTINLSIEKGDFIAILGGNGSGKSTMCKLLNGLIPHYYVGDFSGEVTVNGYKTSDYKVADLSKHVGYVYQDFENQIVSPKVLEDACFAPLHYGHHDYRERGLRALNLVGLEDQQDAFIWQLSGGQKHLLALASVLSLNPDIIIIDEPVAQLDPHHAKDIYDILTELNQVYGKTIIVIEHHTEFVASYAKKVVLMDKGTIHFSLPVAEALNQVETLLAHHIYPPQVTQSARELEVEGRLPITLEEALSLFSDTEPKKVTDIPFVKQKEAIVSFESVNFAYKTIAREKKQVLYEVDCRIHEGDYIALVGNNGAGKSSFMRLMTGLVKATSGEVLVDGENTKEVPPEYLAEKVTYIHQNPEQMFIEDCVEKDVAFFMKSRKIKDYQAKVEALLEQFELTDLADRDSRLLSGGQQRRASLAIGVGMNPEIMLLDEPTANLDIATRKHITILLDSLKKQLKAVVIATHDMQLACEFANRIIVMHEGRIIHDGDRTSVFQNYRLLEKAGLVPPQIFTLTKSLGWLDPAYTVDEFTERYQREEVGNGVYA
ncbi:ATP-binding cassette domain-containing protein [Gracilibacillus salitolerans]|uniref:ATP-binding cassette domain-containing protein n=1 Tax=Gracilibacillus salitolerans TaxID=2663022 RepID=A0A5Q2TP71_9BACI|nr:energy-coupling factor transporter ATPase [Gracilibacillus salitolerans]QGH35823.1 ATP-binding cassette domain-containing protein [Gracilibacillus salitolerans]